MSVLHAFCRHSNIILILRFVETSYLDFIEIQLTGYHMMQDLGVGNLGTDY